MRRSRVANKLTETLQWGFVIDNRPGAGGNLGMDVAAKAEPDGYTIVMDESSNLTINPALYRKMPFDPATDLVPVAFVGTVPLVLVVAADSPYTTLAALTAAAKNGQLTLASSRSRNPRRLRRCARSTRRVQRLTHTPPAQRGYARVLAATAKGGDMSSISRFGADSD